LGQEGIGKIYGTTHEEAIKQLREAIDSFQEVYEAEEDIYSAPVSIEALHEFLASIALNCRQASDQTAV